MSKFDEHFESGTVANQPLQQPAFAFYPEEALLQRAIAAAPDVVRKEAFSALDRRSGRLKGEEHFLRVCAERCAAVAEDLATDAADFAKKLPQSLFGAGNGSDFVLPIGLFFERVKARETVLRTILLDLDRFWEPDPFDPHRFSFAGEILSDRTLIEAIGALSARIDESRKRAQAFSERIGVFCETVTGTFFERAASISDLDHNGAGMRFGALAGLCGELRHAAQSFAAQCRENPPKRNNGKESGS